MMKVLYTSPYVPAEWVAAHGFEPVRVTPSRASRAPAALDRRGVCPFVRNFVADAFARTKPAAIVMTTVCDQMRRAFDVVTHVSNMPAFLLNVPSTWQSVAVRRLYMDELDRLSGFLTRAGGVRPSSERLIEVMLRCDDKERREFDSCRMGFGPCGFSHPATPVALVGGPLCREDAAIFDLITASGGYVVLDATESGLAGMRRRFDRRRVRAEPLLELADAYFDGIRDVSRRPNGEFYGWLLRELTRNDVRAIVVHRHLWCDLWHAEVQRLRERSGLPVLDLDAGDAEAIDSGRNHTRIGAFMEMLT
jgi:benzoyl-CoA reductase/2-hydroxyglutaryl-CoA dehydratase subunit BcrC/BadD/HgdB